MLLNPCRAADETTANTADLVAHLVSVSQASHLPVLHVEPCAPFGLGRSMIVTPDRTVVVPTSDEDVLMAVLPVHNPAFPSPDSDYALQDEWQLPTAVSVRRSCRC